MPARDRWRGTWPSRRGLCNRLLEGAFCCGTSALTLAIRAEADAADIRTILDKPDPKAPAARVAYRPRPMPLGLVALRSTRAV